MLCYWAVWLVNVKLHSCVLTLLESISITFLSVLIIYRLDTSNIVEITIVLPVILIEESLGKNSFQEVISVLIYLIWCNSVSVFRHTKNVPRWIQQIPMQLAKLLQNVLCFPTGNASRLGDQYNEYDAPSVVLMVLLT